MTKKIILPFLSVFSFFVVTPASSNQINHNWVSGFYGSYTEGLAVLAENVEAFVQTPTIDEKVEKMSAVVDLSAEQKKKYKALLVKSEKDKEELKQKSETVSKEEKKKLQTAYKQSYEAELKKILTAEQYKKLEAAKEKAQK